MLKSQFSRWIYYCNIPANNRLSYVILIPVSLYFIILNFYEICDICYNRLIDLQVWVKV